VKTEDWVFVLLVFLGFLSTCIPRPRKIDVPENLEREAKEAKRGKQVPKGKYKPLR
jgi:hypothetical protein